MCDCSVDLQVRMYNGSPDPLYMQSCLKSHLITIITP